MKQSSKMNIYYKYTTYSSLDFIVNKFWGLLILLSTFFGFPEIVAKELHCFLSFGHWDKDRIQHVIRRNPTFRRTVNNVQRYKENSFLWWFLVACFLRSFWIQLVCFWSVVLDSCATPLYFGINIKPHLLIRLVLKCNKN